MNTQTPIFTRTFDLLTWLLPRTNSFPKIHRHTYTRRLLDASFNLSERLEEANIRKGQQRQKSTESGSKKLVGNPYRSWSLHHRTSGWLAL